MGSAARAERPQIARAVPPDPQPARPTGQPITGRMADLYDVFVDWEGRLGREMPGLTARLHSAGARRVLDLGCGTGRHVAALCAAGFDAHGADASPDMLAQARGLLRERLGEEPDAGRLFAWRMGEPPPAELARAAPFDAATALGNVWPLLAPEADLSATARALGELVRPGGLVLLGLKAFAVRRERGDPYLPLLKRRHAGRALWFLRFVDFDVPPLADGTEVCDLHMVVVAGEARPDGAEPEALVHRASRVRVWSPDGLERWFRARGFGDVHVSGAIGDPAAPVRGEDVFVGATVPAGDGP
jgi:SAM-dependent methyltransferase